MFTTNWRPLHTHEDTELSAYRLWLQYIDEKNDRSLVHEDDDKWGINTAQCGKNIAFRKELAGSEAPEIQQFREYLIAVFQYKDLMMDIQDALTVYNEEYNVNDAADLIRLGVMTDMNQAMDVTIPITLKSTEPHFDYFFAVKCGQLDLMEFDAFLNYQIRETFFEDTSVFCEFLSGILLKYFPMERSATNIWPILRPEIQVIFQQKIENLKKIHHTFNDNIMSQVKTNNSPTSKINVPELSNRMWAAFCIISLETFGIEKIKSSEHVSNVARFLHLILGKPLNEVTTSEIYKRLQEVLDLKNENQLKKDLITLRPLLESVNWVKAIENLDLKINALEEKNKKKKF